MVLPDLYSRRFRKRPPRIFGEDQLIIPYNYDHSVGNEYIRKLGYKVKTSEEFQWVENDCFRVNKKLAEFCMVLTDRNLYIIRVKRDGVSRFTEAKLHKLKQLDIYQNQENNTSVDIVGIVPIHGAHSVINLSDLNAAVAKELVDNLHRVMNSLNMDIQIRLHR